MAVRAKRGRASQILKPAVVTVVEPELGQETISAKKVRCSLFQETKNHVEDELCVGVLEESHLPVDKETTNLAAMETSAELGDDLAVDNADVEVDSADEAEEDFTESVTAAMLAELDLVDDLHTQKELTDFEQVNMHAELVEWVQAEKVVKNRGSKTGRGKTAARSTTPLRGISVRKLALVNTLSPRRTPQTNKPKEGKNTEQGRGSISIV